MARKGKAMITYPSQQEDHSPVIVLEEESAATPTRPVELITPQPGGESRWYIQHKSTSDKLGVKKKTP